jgi:Fe-S-cluster containining protein
MSSLCDVCFEPGHCCKGFELYLPDNEDGYKEDILTIANVNMALFNIPFIAIGHSESGTVLFKCPLLDRDGYCTDYQNRPKICRRFEPASDKLCVFFNHR